MASKQRLYDLIDSSSKPHFTKGEVKGFINSVGGAQFGLPKYLKKGDIISNNVGAKKRPCVVIKVFTDVIYAIPLSSNEDELNLCKSKSRFWGDGWFSCGIIAMTKTYAMDNFLGVYDNPKLLNKVIKLSKQEINKI